jgi:hypothetical protein
MRRGIARVGRLVLAAALAYLIVGVIWETAFGLALDPSATAAVASPWEGLFSFLAWFVLPSVFWPSSMAVFVPGGAFVAFAMFAVMTVLMFGALTLLAPGVAAPIGLRRPPRRRSAPRAPAGRPRTS